MSTTARVNLEIEANIHAITFTANGEYLVGGGDENVQIWRAKDGELVATMPVLDVRCVAVSKDGRWIAAGSGENGLVWNATTHEQVLVHKTENAICDVDFSSDSSGLVSASGHTATIVDVAASKQVQTLCHDEVVLAAKYAPQGGRIATATPESVRVWDSNDGRVLVDIELKLNAPRCLLWHDDYLFVNTKDGKIKQINAPTGSTLSEWTVPTDQNSCISLPQHGKFIACSANKTIAFAYTLRYTQPDLIPYTDNIRSIALSPDGQRIVVADDKRITVKSKCCLVSDSDIDAQDPAFKLWRLGQLSDTEALLIPTPQNRAGILASRALIRAHLRKWDEALVDADESIELLPSTFGYIAKAFALVGKGEKHKAVRVCDLAFLHGRLDDNFPLLLFKAIVLFAVGEHLDTISRIDDLIADTWEDQRLRETQAYMHFRLGNRHMENCDFGGAIQSFEDARVKLADHTHPSDSMVIPLLFGQKCDNFAFAVKQRLCEALLMAGRMKDASEHVLRMADQENMTELTEAWVPDFIQRCLSTPGNNGVSTPHNSAPVPEEASDGSHLLPLLRLWARLKLTIGSWRDALTAAAGFMLPTFAIYRAICERLEVTDNVADAVACFHQMTSELAQETDGERGNWTRDFLSRCSGKLEDLGEGFMNAKQYDKAVSQYTAALSLNPVNPRDLLVKRSNASMGMGARKDAVNDAKEWARLALVTGSWKDALAAATGFLLPRLAVYRVLCEHLEMTDHVVDAVGCFHQLSSELAQEINDDQEGWTHNFLSRSRDKLEDLGESFMNAKQYEEAISQYTAALSLDPANPRDLLVNRSKALAEQEKWGDALDDANKVIKLDPSFPLGYERKHAALFDMGRYADANDAFEIMLSKMAESSDPKIRERSRRYVHPEQTKKAIRASIKRATRNSPLVLIDTASGRLCKKAEQVTAFESTPASAKLTASMTTRIDQALIDQVVGEFYRYATLSHTWQADEPLYEHVIKIVVYDLAGSLTHDKLRKFCEVARDEGFNWAWSDTCCIDKADNPVLQESLVSMFKWYEGSAMTLIFLFDVDELMGPGALVESIWNSRGWTLQEYHASKVVRIYTKDWKPYLGLTIHNHKEAHEIIEEMEKATGISAQALRAIRPGLSDIREKLRLASTRQTTRVEDAAYSLLGIFSVPLVTSYGEGDQALGRLLSQLLASSGDTSILAWTGISSGYNSCLPANNSVFSEPLDLHIPPALAGAEMEEITTALRTSSLDLNSITRLYNQLIGLSMPFFVGQRMKLPCLTFAIRNVSPPFRKGSDVAFRAQAGALGIVEIKTRINLTKLGSLFLVHPWIDFLLNRHAAGRIKSISKEHEFSSSDEFISLDSLPELSGDLLDESLPSPLPVDTETHSYEFLARLRQPFGALLLRPSQRNTEYTRIVTDSLITAQVEEITPTMLETLIQSVRVLDVL